MLPKADLHIHTTCSDGRLQPCEAVEVAKERNLSALSITDHDTIEGYLRAKDHADKLDIELIPGVEITSAFNGNEAHILAYYFDFESEPFTQLLLKQRVGRRERIKGIITTINSNGVEIDYEEVRAVANGANIGRPHVAQLLIKKGYVRNYFEAFERYLSTEQLGGIDHQYPDYKEVIKAIKLAGGAAILAHPGKLYSTADIELFISAGIDGIECVHPSHNYTFQKKYSELVAQRALLMTGGSDYHGSVERAHIHIGTVSIAAKYVEKMKRMTNQRKQIVEAN
ncbi:MAG: PHP domain-containing protein [Balneolaceae bacterium]|nr:PHP domain-containing protein [Balneolaceae bacterium]